LTRHQFLVHADFVTQANREDIVVISQRNQDLRSRIVDAFMEAISQFTKSTDLSLAFSWVRYLPHSEQHWDPFWCSLVRDLLSRVRSQPCFKTSANSFRRIADLRHRQSHHNDREGQALFRDLVPAIYLADGYTEEDVGILKHPQLGLRDLDIADVIQLAQGDLRGNTSRLRDEEPVDTDWHKRVASFFIDALGRRDKRGYAPSIKSLKLIPLLGGDWVCATQGQIAHPEASGFLIPPDLGLRLVHPTAVWHPQRERLFEDLGMVKRSPEYVRSLILSRYLGDFSQVSADDLLQHTSFLHETQHLAESTANLNREFRFPVISKAGWIRPRDSDVYPRNDDPLGAWKLLGPEATGTLGFYFLSPIYSIYSAVKPKWEEWLHEYLGVRRHIRLLQREKPALSPEALHVAENQPEKFLQYLMQAWAATPSIAKSHDAIQQLRKVQGLCRNGRRVSLCETYLPLNQLIDTCKRFVPSDGLPFLRLPVADDDAALNHNWSFLTRHLGVGCQQDLAFHLRLLRAAKEYSQSTSEQREQIPNGSQIAHLYWYICRISSAKDEKQIL
jgi:hypothetical protein